MLPFQGAVCVVMLRYSRRFLELEISEAFSQGSVSGYSGLEGSTCSRISSKSCEGN
ncbi:hypothetical protein ACFOUP_15245 [Belliella kenyensis]|uniref:Uncharacterized protein n=1 Tax=Belliella kenyensis TaxID=1472724 RepID=A0ABV8EN54_9BACT|nr:hypothetical protein [Belliella kenyensis]MCH7402088.1 hypothetical protein [Belliella kenyensis]MDN3601530.1 hypothetical protein [Belliella kenyensis]MDN3605252.1 hypothetical protein [Belliella kenyensis]